MEGGHLVYHINLGSGEESVTIGTQLVNDARWHVFTAERTALSLSLFLDDSNLTHTLSGTDLTLDIDPSQVYAGGFPSSESDDIIANAYTGCLEDIRIDGNILPTVGSNSFARITFGGGAPISYNCALKGCSPFPCGSEANCTEVGDTGYQCQCSDGSVTQSRPCAAPAPPSMFLLVVVVGPVVVAVLLCVIITLIGELLNV